MNTYDLNAPPKLDDDRWLPSREAASYLGAEPSTLAKWRYQGIGPPYSCAFGRDPRYLLSDLRAHMKSFIAKNTVEARSLRREAQRRRLEANLV
jgi:hypothetical protein